jgi:hypothetical protein
MSSESRPPGAVNGLLDREHLRVFDRLTQKGEHAVEALKRLVDQHVALAQLREDRGACDELARPHGIPRRKQQRRVVDQIDELREPHQVHGPVHAVQRGFWQVELAQQKVRKKLRTTGRYLEPHRLAVMPLLQPLAQGRAQVAHILFVEREVRVARDAKL